MEYEKQKTGRKPHITLQVVKRVSRRFGMGLPLEDALAKEQDPSINTESWAKAIKRHPQFSAVYNSAKGSFYDEALRRLIKDKNLKWLCWVLERRHSKDFGRTPGPTVNVTQTQEIVGVPNELLARAREYARNAK